MWLSSKSLQRCGIMVICVNLWRCRETVITIKPSPLPMISLPNISKAMRYSTGSETRMHNEVKKLGQNQRQGWEQSCRKKSHRRVLATKAQSWSKGGQGTVFRSTVNVSLSVFLQALRSSPLASLKSVLSYTWQAKSNFSASSSESLLLLLLFFPAWGRTLRGNHKKPPCSLQAPA